MRIFDKFSRPHPLLRPSFQLFRVSSHSPFIKNGNFKPSLIFQLFFLSISTKSSPQKYRKRIRSNKPLVPFLLTPPLPDLPWAPEGIQVSTSRQIHSTNTFLFKPPVSAGGPPFLFKSGHVKNKKKIIFQITQYDIEKKYKILLIKKLVFFLMTWIQKYI